MRNAIAALLPAVLSIGACGGGDAGDAAAGAEYVGGAACSLCHEAETTLWSGSHHDLAMQPASDETVLGDFANATLDHRGVRTTFYRRDGDFFVRTEGRDGELQEFQVTFAFGVTPLQQYLIPFDRGRYQVLGIAWDSRPASDGGQRWFHLYPDLDVGPESPFHWTRPSQNWNTQCAECHSTNLDKGFDVASRTFATTWSEIDVSCEACHGPASIHVSLAGAVASEGATRARGDWGFPVALGDPDRSWGVEVGATTATLAPSPSARAQVEACARCHARRATIATAHDPAAELLDSHVASLLREDLYHSDGQISDEVYVYGSFVQSKMYAAGVTCSDCHDPHSLRTRAEGNAVCTQCHQAATYDRAAHHFHDASSPGARCVECHMPETTYMVVDPRRDHSIRIPRPDLSASIGVPNACNRCHTDRSVEWAVESVKGWYGSGEPLAHYGVTLHAGRLGDPTAVAGLTRLAGDPAEPAIVRASALSLLSGYPPAAVVSALRTGLSDTEGLVRLGALQGSGGLPPATVVGLAYPLLTDPVRGVRTEAARLLASLPRDAATPEQDAVIQDALLEYESTRLVNADHSGAWVGLADLYSARGRVVEAQAAYGTALELDSTDLVASLNLADLFRSIGRDDLGDVVLGRALVSHGESAELLHAIGLSRVRRGDADEALTWLERAADANPGNARFAYVLGVALASTGESAEARLVLETALFTHPYDRDLLTALAAYTRDAGEIATALGYAERLLLVAPDAPGAEALARRLREAGR